MCIRDRQHGGISLNNREFMSAKDLSTSKYSSYIVFITGGTKSGKSEFAEHLAKEV